MIFRPGGYGEEERQFRGVPPQDREDAPEREIEERGPRGAGVGVSRTGR
jgi:hypothetical protein